MMRCNYQCRLTLGVLLVGLASCGREPQPESAVPETSIQPAAETIVSSALERMTSEPEPSSVIATADDIWARLRQADTHYYVLMRHALAPGTGDPDNFQVDDCSTQRNLSEEGRAQARRTGDRFREQGVTVQQVLSSEWCRCLDTAELMDLGPVETFPTLNSFFQTRAQGPERTQQLRDFMMNNRDNAGVTVLVTHFVNIAAIANGGVSSGGFIVIQINDDNELEIVEHKGIF